MKRLMCLLASAWVFLCVFGAGAWAEGTDAPDQYEAETAVAPALIGELKLAGDIAAPGVEQTIDTNFFGDLDQNDWYRVTLRDESVSPSCFPYRLRFEARVTSIPDVLLFVGSTLNNMRSSEPQSPSLEIVELWVNSCGSAQPYLINVRRGPGSPVPVQYSLNLRLNRDIPPPVITEISPTNGPVGTTVTVTGQRLLPYIKFNGASAAVTSYTPNSMIAAVPPGASTGPISVHTAVSQQIFTVTRGTSPTTKKGESTVETLCCTVLANSNLKGRLGRLVITYPDGARTSGTRVDVYKAGETKAIAGEFGNYTLELFPGSYEVVISGQRVTGVTVKSAHNTTVKVGVLRITADKNTRVELIDPKSGKALTGDFGSRDYGLPVGPVTVRISGQSETVTINDGAVTDF